MENQTTKTTCPYCGVGCGIDVNPVGPNTWKVEGDPIHPTNQGKLCAKGMALADTLELDGRLLTPKIGSLSTGWAEALDHVASRFKEIINRHGPESVAFYLSGQMLTEDYYVANKLMKGFIGSPHIDTNSRLCMSSTVAGHQRAFGADVMPACYDDIEEAELFVLVGSNMAWCHPILFQRILKARESRPTQLVVIDPRCTATGDAADLHLPIRPGTDTTLFNGLFNYLSDHNGFDPHYIENHTEGFHGTLETAKADAPSIESVAEACGLNPEAVSTFYKLFIDHPKTLTFYSQGVNQSSSGTDKVNSLINCHLATGRIGKPGSAPFSLTGQTNAMGGREVGGLANQLAAHTGYDDPADRNLIERFWNAPNLVSGPGHKAVELFRAIDKGEIKAVWIMATNPVVSLPDADRVREALYKCEFVVVSEAVESTDTTACADVLLPAATWAEKEGTITNSERRISRQRSFLPLPGQARQDWWIISQVAHRLGYRDDFNYNHPADIFREHARLSGFENQGQRAFNISGLAQLSDPAYQALQPIQWPVTATAPQGTARLYGDGRFTRKSSKAHLIPVSARQPTHLIDLEFPLVLNTGRMRDQWHTMGRTGQVAKLSQHRPEPFLEIHPTDAAQYGLDDGGLVSIKSTWGEAKLRLQIVETQRPGSVFAPMHWSDEFASHARIDAVVAPETDALSGQPESKYTPVSVEPITIQWQGFLLTRDPIRLEQSTYWARSRRTHGWCYRVAAWEADTEWHTWLEHIVPTDADWLEYRDPGKRQYRAAVLENHQLKACLYVGASPGPTEPQWLADIMAHEIISAEDRTRLLMGELSNATIHTDPIICSCNSIPASHIISAYRQVGCSTIEQVRAHTGAGNGCGSCLSEVAAVIAVINAESPQPMAIGM